jgi:hypothetical protein
MLPRTGAYQERHRLQQLDARRSYGRIAALVGGLALLKAAPSDVQSVSVRARPWSRSTKEVGAAVVWKTATIGATFSVTWRTQLSRASEVPAQVEYRLLLAFESWGQKVDA